jgi:hypothetical protein
VNLFEHRRVEVPAGDPGLIGDQDQRKSSVPQQLQSLTAPGANSIPSGSLQMDLIDDESFHTTDERNEPSRI